MGCRGRPSLKISNEARLERRRAQLAESQRKCRARKRQNKVGEQTPSASASPSSEAIHPESPHLDMEILEIGGSSDGGSPSNSHSLKDTVRENAAVSGVAPASLSDLNNQVPNAHSADMKPEQMLLIRGSMNRQISSSDLDCLTDGLGGLDTGLDGFEYDEYLESHLAIGYNDQCANESPESFGHSYDMLSTRDYSPSLSPLTQSFQQDSSIFSYDNDTSKYADFTLFDLDPALTSLNLSWNFQESDWESMTDNFKLDDGGAKETNPKVQNYGGVSPISHYDATMSDLLTCYWQPGSPSSFQGDIFSIDS
jgi:hypothetical protein